MQYCSDPDPFYPGSRPWGAARLKWEPDDTMANRIQFILAFRISRTYRSAPSLEAAGSMDVLVRRHYEYSEQILETFNKDLAAQHEQLKRGFLRRLIITITGDVSWLQTSFDAWHLARFCATC